MNYKIIYLIIGFIFYSCVQDLPLASNDYSVDLSDEDIQSLERIHRIGLADGQETKYTILMAENTIDARIDRNLATKRTRMQQFLNETELGVLDLDLHYDMLADSNIEEDQEFRNELGL